MTVVTRDRERAAYTARRARARAALRGLDALLVSRMPNLRWLTGFTGSAGALLLRPDGDDLLVVDGRYADRAAEEAPEVHREVTRGDEWLASAVPPGARLGIETHYLSWDRVRTLEGLRPDLTLVPSGPRIEHLRVVKDEVEIGALRRACGMTAEVLRTLLPGLQPGETERSVALRIEDALRAAGADDRAFATIVAGGPNGARPHHGAGDRRLVAGDLVTVDAGALVDGYHADMTRTVAIGTPDERLRRAYDAVREAQAAGVSAVRVGAAPGAVDEAARRVLIEAGLGDAIAHPTGHGVGLELHERPILRRDDPDRPPPGQAVAGAADEPVATLPDRATVTVEPGAYLSGLGGVRIEDTVLVTPNGAEILTPAPTELVIC